MAFNAGTYKWGMNDGTLVNREDLLGIVTQQTPSDTPWMAQAPKTTADGVLHQWLIDTMRAPRLTGAIEGDVYAQATSTTPSRVTNVCMIWREDIGITRTQMKNNPAVGGTYTYEMEKAVKQIGTDTESCVFGNLTSATGASGVARVMKGFQNFITTNTARPASLGATLTAGQLVANDFNRILEVIYTAGGNPDQVFVSPSVKRIVSSFTQTGQNRNVLAAEAKLYLGIDMFQTDFGLLAIVLDRFVPQATNTGTAAATSLDVSGQMFILERAKNRFAWYDPVHHDYVGKLGDSLNGIIVGEGTLEVLNEKANGRIIAINNKSSVLGDA